MATRKGATKTDSQGRRFRYDGRRWVQIKATGNGNNTTSARNRSARQRRSKATVTDSDNRRSSQSSRSNRVTNSEPRTSTGNARVTGLNAQQRRRLPRGQRGGDLARQGGERVSTGRRALPPASSTSLGRGTNQRISGTRTQGQGGNPRSTGARVTSSDNQSSRGSGSSTQQRGGQGGSRRLTGQGQRPQLSAGQSTRSSSAPSRGNDSGNQFRAGNERNRTGTGGRSTVGRGGARTPGLGAPTSLGGKVLGGAGLILQAADIAKDLFNSIGRGEGYGAIPGLLQQVTQGPNTRAQNGGFAGPGGNPDGSGQGQAQQQRFPSGMADMSGDPILPTASQAPQRLPVESYGGNVPAPIPMAAAAASGGVSQGPDTSVFDGMSAEQKMAAWAELFPLLASKVTPGQSGYDVINPSGPPVEQPNPAMTGEGVPRMQETSEQRRRRMMRGYPGNMNY